VNWTDRIYRLFRIGERGSSLRREVTGGITTFLTMAYIAIVNPAMLAQTGMDQGAVITATCLAAMFGTALAGIWAGMPLAMAPGMGLNAFFTYSLVLQEQIAWETALGVVFVSGVFFFLLTLSGLRKKIVDAIPASMRFAVAGGIGLFIAFIGFRNMGLIAPDEHTLLTLGRFGLPAVIGLAGLLLTAVLQIRGVPGALLIGILAGTALALAVGYAELPGRFLSAPPSLEPVFLKLDIPGALKWGLAGAIFSFMFVDLFDSVGTILACAYEGGMTDREGNIPRLGRILEADALATVAGALIGTSTTTTFIESASGIAAGARTGLASLVTASLFGLALFCAPLFTLVPACAAAPALVIVGVFMFKSIGNIRFDRLREGIPSFLTLFIMPLTNISTGISFGFAAYVLIHALSGNFRLPWLVWVIGILSALNLALGGI
jgi:adenine/guanine/hypoxanthine permease